jgi:hypothetical protein
MKIEDLWPQLESARANASKGRKASGWVLRQIRPSAACPLHAGVELMSGQRGLLLRVEPSLVPSKRHWPNCRVLEVVSSPQGTELLFGVMMKEARHSDMFSALAEDLARRVSQAPVSEGKISALLGGLARWQKFLASKAEGLSPEARRGLWAELHFLGCELVPACGPERSVAAWQGPTGAAQDFLIGGGAIEIKATSGKPPFVVTVSSERQLDSQGLSRLFLRHYALAEREGAGEALPVTVAKLRALLAGTAAAELFEDRLLQAGYLDVHAPLYETTGWIARGCSDFAVKKGFPRIVEKDLPPGVGSLRYALALAACEPYAVTAEVLRRAIKSPPLPKHHR